MNVRVWQVVLVDGIWEARDGTLEKEKKKKKT